MALLVAWGLLKEQTGPCLAKACQCSLPRELTLCYSSQYPVKRPELSLKHSLLFFPQSHEPDTEVHEEISTWFVVVIRRWSNHFIKRVLVHNHLPQWQAPGVQDRITALIRPAARHSRSPTICQVLPGLQYKPSLHDAYPSASFILKRLFGPFCKFKIPFLCIFLLKQSSRIVIVPLIHNSKYLKKITVFKSVPLFRDIPPKKPGFCISPRKSEINNQNDWPF